MQSRSPTDPHTSSAKVDASGASSLTWRRVRTTAPLRVKKILFVDDSALLLSSLCRRAKSLERVPLTAQDGATAIELAREHSPELAVIDLLLGSGDNGWEVTRALRALKIPMTIILISGSMCTEYAMTGVAAGADDCYEKPVTVEQLIARAETGVREAAFLDRPPTLVEMEWAYIARTLEENRGNRSVTARVLGISRATLHRKLSEHGPGAVRPKVVRRKPRRRKKG